MRLHELAREYASLVEDLDESVDPVTGEVASAEPDEVALTLLLEGLAAAEGDLDRRVEHLALLVLDLRAEAEACREEERRLAARRRAREARSDRIRAYILACLEAAGLERAGGARAHARRTLGPPAVEIEDASRLPEGWLAPPKPREADKRAILDAWRRDRVPVEASLAACGGEVVRRARVDIR